MAELVLGGVGAAVGSVTGVGWVTGFQIGVTLGSILFPPSGPKLERGRLDEIRIQGASQGSPIPIVFGRNRTAGTIIWATGITETSATSSSGGKGGGGVRTTSYSYTSSLAIVVCEGTITKIRRIWANETVIYDWRTGGSPTYAGFLDSSKVRVYLGNQTAADAAIEADKGAGNVPAHKGLAYVVFEDFPLSEFGNQIPNFTFEVESSHADLEAALEEVAAKVGLEASDYDFSAVTGYPTRGLLVGARTEASNVFDAFAKSNLFEIVETEGKIKVVVRSGVSVLTIPASDIGAGDLDNTDGDRFVMTTRAEETELPREFVVSYASEANDFLTWTQTARRTVRWSENQDQIAFPMSLADAYARYLADALLMERWASRGSHKFTLPYKYLRLDPGDVVTIPDESGGTRVVRILELSAGLLAHIEVFAVDDDPIIYVDPGLPASIPTGGGAGVTVVANADLLVVETNAVYDDFADYPTLGIVAGRTSAGWKGGTAQADPLMTTSGGAPALEIAEFEASSTFGYTTADAFGILGLSGGASLLNDLDTVNTVRVTLTSGSLSSVTYDEMVTLGKNLAIIGNEILQFQTATLVSGTTYTLSNLRRFRRGTDYLYANSLLPAAWAHASSEAFILVNDLAKAFEYYPSLLGSSRSFRIIEKGKDYSGGLPSFTEALTLAGLSRLPYGPTDLRYSGDRSGGTADVTLTWVRRVRTGGDLLDYEDAPLDELVEAYEIDLYVDDLSFSYRTITGITSPSYTYTVAEQTSDGVEASGFYYVVYQVSSEPGIGRGHPSVPKLVTLNEDNNY